MSDGAWTAEAQVELEAPFPVGFHAAYLLE